MPSDAEPLVRARALKDWLANVARVEDPWRTRFFDALRESDRVTIESASRVAWLPMQLHVMLADVTQETFSPTKRHEYYRKAVARSLRTPPFDSVMRAATRLLGMTPGTFLRWASKGWELSFRNCGSIAGELHAPGRGRLVYRDLPAVCTASDPWLDSAEDSAYGVYDVFGVTGMVRVDKTRRAAGGMELALEWKERGAE